MKGKVNKLVMAALSSLLLFSACKETKKAALADTVTKVITLKYTMSGGNNGMSVAYDPDRNIYYAAIGGNDTYPLEAFDQYGNSLGKSKAGFDVRGMWWNKKTKKLEMNGYSDFGLATANLDDKGLPTGSITKMGGSGQPDVQAVGTFNASKNEILYLNEDVVTVVDRKTFTVKTTFTLKGTPVADYLNNVLVYTGIKGKELGRLDYENHKLYLYSRKSGKLTAQVQLPYDAPVHDSFRISYANGLLFLYNADTRSWSGYKITQ